VTGVFDNEDSIALRNRPFNGQPGVHLLTPVRIEGSEQAVLVDRGWIPLEDAEPERWSAYAVEGEVTIEGIAKQKQPRPDGFLVPTDPTPGPGEDRLEQWFRVDIDRIQEQMPYPLLPIFIEQSPDGHNTPPLQEGDPVLDEGPHLGYALQWFTFSLILVITYGAFMRQEIKRKDEKE
jgi:surfeit locus 1 family protein